MAYALRELAQLEDVVLLLDANLRGLAVEYLEQLMQPVISGAYIQSGGVCDGWDWRRYLSRYHIGLTGQRAFRVSILWEIYELDYQGWSLEVSLNSICRSSPKRRKRQIAKVFLDGVQGTDKAEKYPTRALATAAKRAVFAQWLKGLLRFNLPVRIKHWLV